MKPIHIIGVPLDLGGARRGVDMGPSAVRIAGLGEAIARLGRQAIDKGNLPAPIAETEDALDRQKKYIEPIADVCRALYASCSALRAENADVVAAFLAEYSDAQDHTVESMSALGYIEKRAGPGYPLFVGEAQMDGFYYACLIKS